MVVIILKELASGWMEFCKYRVIGSIQGEETFTITIMLITAIYYNNIITIIKAVVPRNTICVRSGITISAKVIVVFGHRHKNTNIPMLISCEIITPVADIACLAL